MRRFEKCVSVKAGSGALSHSADYHNTAEILSALISGYLKQNAGHLKVTYVLYLC